MTESLKVARAMRARGLTVHAINSTGRLKKQMKFASKLQCAVAVLVGPNEVARGGAHIKNMNTGEQVDVNLDEVANFIVTTYNT